MVIDGIVMIEMDDLRLRVHRAIHDAIAQRKELDALRAEVNRSRSSFEDLKRRMDAHDSAFQKSLRDMEQTRSSPIPRPEPKP
jgi:predicted  nucleic acid-binding Zn-ribbon protein